MSKDQNTYSIIVPAETLARARAYLLALQSGQVLPGRFLQRRLDDAHRKPVSELMLLEQLIETKQPQIFAESEVAGDGSDWNLTELGLLGDISFATGVTVYDNGNHSRPSLHHPPFPGTLVFTPGALLRNDRGFTPADWCEATDSAGRLSPAGYYALYRRRLSPVMRWINSHAGQPGGAVITIPGLGCGQFAGPFRGSLGSQLSSVLRRLVEQLASELQNIRVVYFDPYRECSNHRSAIGDIRFMVRPLMEPGNQAKSQLSHPSSFEEEGDEFATCALYSIVAWDHVSWPGNDFYAGLRATDDGVKAAATNSMHAITGIEGRYDPPRFKYLPPAPYASWAEVVCRNKLQLWRSENIAIYQEEEEI